MSPRRLIAKLVVLGSSCWLHAELKGCDFGRLVLSGQTIQTKEVQGRLDLKRLAEDLEHESEARRFAAIEGLLEIWQGGRLRKNGVPRSYDRDSSREAWIALAKHGPQVARDMIRRVDQPATSMWTRSQILHSMKYLGGDPKDTLPFLDKLLDDKRDYLWAIRALSGIGKPAWPLLLRVASGERKTAIPPGHIVHWLCRLRSSPPNLEKILLDMALGTDAQAIDQVLPWLSRRGKTSLPGYGRLLKQGSGGVRLKTLRHLGDVGQKFHVDVAAIFSTLGSGERRVDLAAFQTLKFLSRYKDGAYKEDLLLGWKKLLDTSSPEHQAVAKAALDYLRDPKGHAYSAESVTSTFELEVTARTIRTLDRIRRLGKKGVSELPALVAIVRQRNPLLRMPAMKVIAALGEAAVPTCLSLLSANNWELTTASLSCLSLMGAHGSRAAEGVRALLSPAPPLGPMQRAQVYTCLIDIGDFRFVFERTLSESKEFRAEYLHKCSLAVTLKDHQLQDLIETFEKRGKPERRLLLLWALGGSAPSPSARKLVRRLLEDPDPEIRALALEVAPRTGGAERTITQRYLEQLKRGDATQQRKAITNLLRFGSVPYLRDVQRFLSDDKVRQRVGIVLCRYGAPRDFVDQDVLTGLLDPLPELRRIAIQACAKWGDRASPLVPQLLILARGPDEQLSALAVGALTKVGLPPDELYRLCLPLVDNIQTNSQRGVPKNWAVLVDVLRAAESAGPMGLLLLQKALASKNWPVRSEAVKRLVGHGRAANQLTAIILKVCAEMRDRTFDRAVLELLATVRIDKDSTAANYLAPLLRRTVSSSPMETMKVLANHPAWGYELCDLPLSLLRQRKSLYGDAALLALSKALRLPKRAFAPIRDYRMRNRDRSTQHAELLLGALSRCEEDPRTIASVLFESLLVDGWSRTAGRLLGDMARSHPGEIQEWIWQSLRKRARDATSMSMARGVGTGLGAFGVLGRDLALEMFVEPKLRSFAYVLGQQILVELGARDIADLRPVLLSEDEKIRGAAIRACGKLGGRARPLVRDIIEVATREARDFDRAVMALGQIRSTDAISFLKSYCRGETPSKSQVTLRALAELGGLRALSILFEATCSNDALTRAVAIRILTERKATPGVGRVIKSIFRTELPDKRTRRALLGILDGSHDEDRAILFALDLPDDELTLWVSRIRPEDSDEFKVRCLRWLLQSEERAAMSVPAFTSQLVSRNSELRILATLGLGWMPNASSPTVVAGTVTKILSMQYDWDPLVRRAVNQSLRCLGDDSAQILRCLEASLRDRSLDVACEAALALGSLGPKARGALSALMHASSSKHPKLAEAAAAAIRRIER